MKIFDDKQFTMKFIMPQAGTLTIHFRRISNYELDHGQ